VRTTGRRLPTIDPDDDTDMHSHESLDHLRPSLRPSPNRSVRPLLGLGAAALTATALVTGLASWSSPVGGPLDRAAAVASQDDKKKEFDDLYDAAKGDVEKLWELYDWCEGYGMQKYHKRVLNAILREDEENRKAHELLGHEYYDGKWWDDPDELAEYRIEKEREEAEAKGWVQYKGRWVDPADIPFLERGLVKDDEGNWVDPEVQKKLAEGWVRQDLEWIPPAEVENVEKGLWKCGEKWLSLEDANTYHSQLGREWRIPYDEGFVIRTTLPRATADTIAEDLRRAARDVERFFGRRAHDVHLLLVDSQDVYNEFAGGLSGSMGTDATGWSSVRGAYFADANWVAREQTYDPIGVGLWDLGSEHGASFGRHYSRYAYGIAAAESFDSSPEARERIAKSGVNDGTLNAFYREKKLPPVLRFGFASYVDRYFVETTSRDPHWARRWSVQNLTAQGGLEPLTRVLAMELTPRLDDEAAATQAGKVLNQAGLVVSFILDADCAPVKEAHAAFKAAMLSGDAKAVERTSKALIDAVRENEGALRRWAESA